MKRLVRNIIINMGALFLTSQVMPGFMITDGFKTLLIGAFAVMVINFTVIPMLKLMFLPLNLLTFGFFTWVINVLALYFLITVFPSFKLVPYAFPGASLGGLVLPAITFNTLQVAVIASFLIGFSSNIIKWFIK